MTDIPQYLPPHLAGVGNPNPNSFKSVEARLSAIEARLTAIEGRLVKIDEFLYVPPELAKKLRAFDKEVK